MEQQLANLLTQLTAQNQALVQSMSQQQQHNDQMFQSLSSAVTSIQNRNVGVIDVRQVGKPDLLKGNRDVAFRDWPSWSYSSGRQRPAGREGPPAEDGSRRSPPQSGPGAARTCSGGSTTRASKSTTGAMRVTLANTVQAVVQSIHTVVQSTHTIVKSCHTVGR